MSATMTWAARVEAYLAYRRSFGFDLSVEGGQLGSFARFADRKRPAKSSSQPLLSR